jgi:hypothetical protein
MMPAAGARLGKRKLMTTTELAADFEDYLVTKGALARSGTRPGNARAPSYRTMYEHSSLEPAAFADAVAEFHDLPRAALETMRAGKALIEAFSASCATWEPSPTKPPTASCGWRSPIRPIPPRCGRSN